MMPAGNYYIGDLCYVLTGAQWNEVCALTANYEEGEFTLSDGTKIAVYSTSYGDGTYEDNRGIEYPVDSGSLGCVLTSSISNELLGDFRDNIVVRPTMFSTSTSEGIITFGDVRIDTGTSDEDYMQYEEGWHSFEENE